MPTAVPPSSFTAAAAAPVIDHTAHIAAVTGVQDALTTQQANSKKADSGVTFNQHEADALIRCATLLRCLNQAATVRKAEAATAAKLEADLKLANAQMAAAQAATAAKTATAAEVAEETDQPKQ